MSLSVKLEVFEGPLDLLLHLIEKNKVDIYDIPIVEITNQYLDYIKALKSQDMNVMSEFLVMAATLVDIKCRMLLPKEVNEEGEEEDPRAELVEKLLQYKMYKYMAFELRDMQTDAGVTITRGENLPEEVLKYREPIDYEQLVGDLNLVKLHEIFQIMLKRNEDKIDPIRSNFGNVEKEEIDMEEKASYIEDFIMKHKKFSFRELLERQHSKEEIIVSFLVILELIKVGRIKVKQDKINDDITITTVAKAG
ncbi:MAG: segregation/condensation protein A [Lachnospiraceae bacterium]|jgi:segregation and condensation protein A|nr:segregation/condensation protein A [Lachnospiraceae bacterium]